MIKTWMNATIGIAMLIVGGCEAEERSYDRIALSRIDSVQVRDAGKFYSVTVFAGESHVAVDRDKPAGLTEWNVILEPGDTVTDMWLRDPEGNNVHFRRVDP